MEKLLNKYKNAVFIYLLQRIYLRVLIYIRLQLKCITKYVRLGQVLWTIFLTIIMCNIYILQMFKEPEKFYNILIVNMLNEECPTVTTRPIHFLFETNNNNICK